MAATIFKYGFIDSGIDLSSVTGYNTVGDILSNIDRVEIKAAVDDKSFIFYGFVIDGWAMTSDGTKPGAYGNVSALNNKLDENYYFGDDTDLKTGGYNLAYHSFLGQGRIYNTISKKYEDGYFRIFFKRGTDNKINELEIPELDFNSLSGMQEDFFGQAINVANNGSYTGTIPSILLPFMNSISEIRLPHLFYGYEHYRKIDTNSRNAEISDLANLAYAIQPQIAPSNLRLYLGVCSFCEKDSQSPSPMATIQSVKIIKK